MQNLQNSLSSGDLNGANTALQTVLSLNQNLETAGGTSPSTNSQLATDLTALGSALSSGDLSAAQSAFATVQSDLKSSASPSLANENSAASQSEQLVQELLSTVNTNTASSESTTSVLDAVYGSKTGLNIFG